MPSEVAKVLHRTTSSRNPLAARPSLSGLRLLACGLVLALLAGCHRGHLHPRHPHRVIVPVPPHVDVHSHGIPAKHGHKHGHKKHKHKHKHDHDRDHDDDD